MCLKHVVRTYFWGGGEFIESKENQRNTNTWIIWRLFEPKIIEYKNSKKTPLLAIYYVLVRKVSLKT